VSAVAASPVAVIERDRVAQPQPDPRRSAAALIGLSLGAFAFVTLETLPIGLLQPIGADLRVSETAIGSLVTVYAGVVVVSGLPLTYLLRSAPRRRVLATVLLALVGCTLGSAVAPTYGALVVTRIGSALSQALFWSLVVPTASGIFPPSRRGRAVATVFAGSSIAAGPGCPPGPGSGSSPDGAPPSSGSRSSGSSRWDSSSPTCPTGPIRTRRARMHDVDPPAATCCW
jgi:MFS transporter, DHA1 family, inner membrane transport protein